MIIKKETVCPSCDYKNSSLKISLNFFRKAIQCYAVCSKCKKKYNLDIKNIFKGDK